MIGLLFVFGIFAVCSMLVYRIFLFAFTGSVRRVERPVVEVKSYFSAADEAEGRRVQGIVFWILILVGVFFYVLVKFS